MQFNDFKVYSDAFWPTQYPEVTDETYEPADLTEQLPSSAFNAVVQGVTEYGSWRFADKVSTGLSKEVTASAMFSMIKQCKQVASEFGVDIFNLPNQLQFTFQQQSTNAVPILKAYFQMFLIEQHVKNDRFRLPKNYFEITEFAHAWGYIQDVRLLLAAKYNGLVVAKYPAELVEKLVCDAHVTKPNVVPYLQ